MDNVLVTLAFGVSALCAALMGFAIQRGATCTVAAVDELVTRKRATRLVALVEASLWVLAGLLIARALGAERAMPAGYAAGAATIAGGALLGIGAYVNRACVFGAIARLGSGEWAYVVTPLGFYVGCVTVGALLPVTAPLRLDVASPALQGPPWLGALAALLVALRGRSLLHGSPVLDDDPRPTSAAIAGRGWSPHAATCVIGATFVVILLASGAWAYTDVLADLAHGMASSIAARIALLLALFGGAVAGRVTAGGFRSVRVTIAQLARCFAGGVLMGWGSLLIPGSNDGLVLVGMPLLRPYAWLAFATMCAVIATAIVAARFSVARAVRVP
jgi:toxin CptA